MSHGDERPQLYVGCPMWAHRSWVGRWFPPGTRSGGELGAYVQWCTAVEGNTTFYALPEPDTVRRWADATPPSFRFAFKLPRTVTHERRLREADSEVRSFCDRLEPLGDRLGPTSIQLPASFGPDDLEVLRTFLGRLPTGWSWAVEVRHPGFFDGSAWERHLYDLLAEHRVDRVVLDSRALFAGPETTADEREAFLRKPRLPVRPVTTAGAPIIRFIGQTDPEANPPFWEPWVPKLVTWLREGRTPYVFVHTPDNVWSPALARRLHHDVAAVVPDLAPLPDPARQAHLW